MSLTLAYITCRVNCRIEWFFDSLAAQDHSGTIVNVIDFYADIRKDEVRRLADKAGITLGLHVPPKPTIWQGPHRLTKEDWWAKSNSLNTAICLCRTDWISFVDDRCVLDYRWLDRVKAAMEAEYAVCGYYEKRVNLQVENGVVVGGEMLGADTRTPGHYPFSTLYGGHCALPLEWCLQVNGVPEVCDGLGLEDSLFGNALRNNGFAIHYDSDMRLIEDRTPGQIEGALKRADKNPHLGQQAKSWALVRMMEGQKTSLNQFDIRNLRDRVLLNGEPLDSIGPFGSAVDWYDNELLADMT